MRKLIVFNQVSLDGYFTDAKGDMSWAHKQDPEWLAFIDENAQGGGEALFGRKTYELMASYWPTPLAMQQAPVVAKAINEMPKVVFSKTLKKADWNNTRLVKRGLAAEVRKMKNEDGPDIVIMGSGSIVSQLAQEGLIDEYQIVVNPIVLGKGRTLFEGVKKKFGLNLTKTRTFKNGNVLMTYEPARQMTIEKKVATIDGYLQEQPPAIRKRLKEIRSIVRSLAPGATEKISYRMPAFFLNGYLVYFAAFKNHIGFYPGPGAVAAFRDEIRKYKSAKGSIQFPHDSPLPVSLIKKIVKYRVKENLLGLKKKE